MTYISPPRFFNDVQAQQDPEPGHFAKYGPSSSEQAQAAVIRARTLGKYGSGFGRARVAGSQGDVAAGQQADLAFDALIDAEYLLEQFMQHRSTLGKAAGVDGITPDNLTRTEAGAGFRALTSAIKQGYWRPEPRKRVRIPKQSGGFRTLSVPVVLERVLSKAINQALLAQVDNALPDAFHGYRPKRSVHSLLAGLQALCQQWGYLVLTQDDIRKAFDFVPIQQAMIAVREQVSDDRLAGVIDTILRGHNNNTIGIAQGDPLSPTVLLLLMSRCLSWPDPSPAAQNPLHRLAYADNLLYASTTAPEGSQALALHREQLLALNMELKGKGPSPVDLRRQGARFDTLGFRFTLLEPGALGFQISPAGWSGLRQSLREAHRFPSSPVVAKQLIRGWIDYFAPAFGPANADQHVERICRLARGNGIRELIELRDLLETAVRANQRWRERLCESS